MQRIWLVSSPKLRLLFRESDVTLFLTFCAVAIGANVGGAGGGAAHEPLTGLLIFGSRPVRANVLGDFLAAFETLGHLGQPENSHQSEQKF
jgi:hypothetical protein